MTEAQALIDLLIERAPAMRTAGITSFSVDGVSVCLAPPDAAPPERELPNDTEPETGDPLSSPATFGRNASLPGFSRPTDEV